MSFSQAEQADRMVSAYVLMLHASTRAQNPPFEIFFLIAHLLGTKRRKPAQRRIQTETASRSNCDTHFRSLQQNHFEQGSYWQQSTMYEVHDRSKTTSPHKCRTQAWLYTCQKCHLPRFASSSITPPLFVKHLGFLGQLQLLNSILLPAPRQPNPSPLLPVTSTPCICPTAPPDTIAPPAQFSASEITVRAVNYPRQSANDLRVKGVYVGVAAVRLGGTGEMGGDRTSNGRRCIARGASDGQAPIR